MRKLKILFALVAAVCVVISLPPAFFLARVWWRDGAAPLPSPAAGQDDASRLITNTAAEVIAVAADPVEAERQLSNLVRRAASQSSHISISGARHSMGGHTIYPGGITLDMLPFNRMSLDEERNILTVGAGARWSEIIPYLDQRGRAVAVMQSNNDFSLGGSISVNCHGWQHNSPPIAGTVESFRLMTPSGSIQRCSRTENPELFSLALGGYGLFGVILEVDLRVVSNEFYVAEPHLVKMADYNRVYHELTRGRSDIGMAYGRINVAPKSFLQEGIITLLKRHPMDRPATDSLRDAKRPSLVKRLIFRGGVGSRFGKNLHWWLEKYVGETAGHVLARNEIMNEPSSLYATRDPGSTDILHEYFVPAARLGEFIEKAYPLFVKHEPEVLNITVRNVETDPDAFLRYAPEEVFGVVMLFNQGRDAASEDSMQFLTRDLIDAVISCGGRYYLPYRPHATVEQFVQAYPRAADFFALKQKYDPAGMFENEFFLNYGKPVLARGPAAGSAP